MKAKPQARNFFVLNKEELERKYGKNKIPAGDWASIQKFPMPNSKVRIFTGMQLAEMREAGIKFVGVLASPNPGEFCETCEAIMFTREKDGSKFDIEFATPLPLPGCNKRYCKCIFIALE